jgi:exonuclease SbcD
MALVRADIATRPAGSCCIVMAHAFVAGGATSDSERDLSVGGAATVPVATFAGADYVALGHLHRPQRVGTAARYAGSPLALSFSEAAHDKSLAIVELGGAGLRWSACRSRSRGRSRASAARLRSSSPTPRTTSM